MKLLSPAFENHALMPVDFTGDGDNRVPPLEWRDVPEGTRSFALVMEDPDAPDGTFHHWAVYNLDPATTRVPEGCGDQPLGHGVNDFRHHGYDGPLPPKGHGLHHYHFKLAALDTDLLDLGPAPSVEAVWREAERHALATAELVGTYER